MRLHASHWLLVVAGGMLLPATAAADDPSAEGVVRLGNAKRTLPSVKNGESGSTEQVGLRRRSGVGSAPVCCPQNGRTLPHGRRSAHACRTGACGRYGNCPRFGHGRWLGRAGYGCPPGGYGCRHGVGYCGTCGAYGCNHPYCWKLMHALHWLSPYHAGCTVPPDHGFFPPGHHPIQRTAATYRRWFPGQWTGEPSAADSNFRYPMVYTPTDTTQLGYYYQRVPVWQRLPGMIPPPPRPNEWHAPDFGGHYGVGNGALCGTQGEDVSGDPTPSPAADGDASQDTLGKPAPIDATPAVPEILEGGSPEGPSAVPAPVPPAA